MAPSIQPSALGSTKRPRSRKSIGYLPSPDEAAASSSGEVLGDATTALDMRLATIKADASSRRSRSKSLGPGGLDALKEGAGNRRKIAAGALPRSILKPMTPLSPLKDIPERKPAPPTKATESPSPSPRRTAPSPQKGTKSSTVMNVINNSTLPLGKKASSPAKPSSTQSTSADIGILDQSPSSDGETKGAQAEAVKQRDLRRKSMANRRVSFAPEATLHTWDMIEELQDSTTSSASTSHTRRASMISNASIMSSPKPCQSPQRSSSATDDPPSTPPSQLEDDIVPESPASQRDLHQKKRRQRRSSIVPPMNFNNPDDVFSSPNSSVCSSDNDGSPTVKDAVPDVLQPRNALGSYPMRSGEPNGIDENTSNSADELGETAMELVNDDVTAAFKPWSQKLFEGGHPKVKLSFSQQHDNVNPFSPAFKSAMEARAASVVVLESPHDGEMSMDITRAIGSIASAVQGTAANDRPPGSSPVLRRSVRDRRRSSGASTSMGDVSMDLTAVIGGLQTNELEAMEASSLDTNEELSMELTSVFGRIQARTNAEAMPQDQIFPSMRNSAMQSGAYQDPAVESHDIAMDLTIAFGNIIHAPVDGCSRQEREDGMDMDMTQAVGAILSQQSQTEPNPSKKGRWFDQSTRSAKSSPQTGKNKLRSPASISAQNPGTPELRVKEKAMRAGSQTVTPLNEPLAPLKSTTPIFLRPVTPETPINMSPTRLSQKEPKSDNEKEASRASSSSQAQGKDFTAQLASSPSSGVQRRISGIGLDKVGVGSPRITMLLNKRLPIYAHAASFSPSVGGPRVVHFDDPRTLGDDLAKTYEHDARRESRQYILEHEVDADVERDATTTLREAIVSMTPKRKRLGGRKSLAIGGAKGLLGVRPLELDDSDGDRTPNGVRSGHSSPIKKIKLSGAHHTVEPTGHTRRPNLAPISTNSGIITPSTGSPTKRLLATTPKGQGRFKDAEALPDAQLPLPKLGHQDIDIGKTIDKEQVEEKIHLREFLNLTSIRFIELNTTKRRHTMGPPADHDAVMNGSDVDSHEPNSRQNSEDSIVAGACTVPLLELFQHSCRELKKYIAEGRDVIREIEAETYSENPLLFQEYISATPANRTIMDQQFKNMKTHARLQSKGMWYEWRKKLLDGLKEGLQGNANGYREDAALLSQQEKILAATLPSIVEEREALELDRVAFQRQADESANFNHEELSQAQQELLKLEHELCTKRQLSEDYQRGFYDLDSAVELAYRTRVEHLHSIKEAQKMREDHRGWSLGDVEKLNASVDALETKHGWTITSAVSGTLTLIYRHQLQVYFTVNSFLPAVAALNTKRENSPISLVYIGDAGQPRPKVLTTEKRFFLQLMRAHIQCLSQHQTSVKDLLRFVQEGWDKACEVSNEISKLEVEFITKCRILSDECLATHTTILLPGLKTKVLVVFEIGAAGKGGEIEAGLSVKAEVVYGEKYKEDKMGDFLTSRAGRGSADSPCSWADAVRDLKKRLIAQGKKH